MPVTRDTYDAYIGRYALALHVDSCVAAAPTLFTGLEQELATWRSENDRVLRRLEESARAWELPGDRTIDSVLAHLRAAMPEQYVGVPEVTLTSRCTRVVRAALGSVPQRREPPP